MIGPLNIANNQYIQFLPDLAERLRKKAIKTNFGVFFLLYFIFRILGFWIQSFRFSATIHIFRKMFKNVDLDFILHKMHPFETEITHLQSIRLNMKRTEQIFRIGGSSASKIRNLSINNLISIKLQQCTGFKEWKYIHQFWFIYPFFSTEETHVLELIT